MVILARFESEEAAKANSERPEQGEWWARTEVCFDGPVRFSESTDVETFLGGGSDDAGFVQIMRGNGADRARLIEADAMWADFVAAWRPDLIGGIRVWTGPDTYVETAYFTNQADAQAGEQIEPPAEFAKLFAEFEELMAGSNSSISQSLCSARVDSSGPPSTKVSWIAKRTIRPYPASALGRVPQNALADRRSSCAERVACGSSAHLIAGWSRGVGWRGR